MSAEQRDDGDERVTQSMRDDNLASRQPLRPCRPHVVLAKDFEEGRAGEPHHPRGAADSEEQGGGQVEAKVVVRVLEEWDVATGGE